MWMWMQGSTYSQPWHYENIGWLALHSDTLPQKSPGTHFTGGWVDPGPFLIWRNEEKCPSLWHLNCPAHSQAPYHLNYMAHKKNKEVYVITSVYLHKSSSLAQTCLPSETKALNLSYNSIWLYVEAKLTHGIPSQRQLLSYTATCYSSQPYYDLHQFITVTTFAHVQSCTLPLVVIYSQTETDNDKFLLKLRWLVSNVKFSSFIWF